MKKVLIPSLIANGVLILLLILLFNFYPSVIQGYVTEYLEKNHERQTSIFEKLPNSKGEIVFLGASIIEGANWNEMFQDSDVKNRGISGDQSKDILSRLDEVIKAKPAKIFLQVGYNDLDNGIKAKKVLENHSEILTKISKDSPQTLVYLLSLTPVLYELNGDKVKTEELMILNGDLRKLAQKRGIQFIDLYASLEGNKNTHELNSEYTNDGLHLNADGYTRVKALLERYVKDRSNEKLPGEE